MSFAPHCGHFLLCKRFSWEHWEEIKRNQRKLYTGSRKEKISREIMIVFHSKEMNTKNVIYYSANNKRIFVK